jgi:hypothetical protein
VPSSTQPPEFETPAGAISRLNLADYDRVILEFRKRDAEREATRDRAREALSGLADQIGALLTRLPVMEARVLADEFRQLEVAERTLADGVIPNDVDKIAANFRKADDQLTTTQKNITKGINTLYPTARQIDPQLASKLRRLLDELGHIVRRLITHYRHMIVRADKLIAGSKTPPDGPIKQACDLYRDAFRSFNGVHAVGKIFPDLRHTPPVYELPIVIDPGVYGNRSRLRELERAADEYVEKLDPTLVGTITFRFELANGAA